MFGSLTSPVNSEKCFNSFATRFLLNELIKRTYRSEEVSPQFSIRKDYFKNSF